MKQKVYTVLTLILLCTAAIVCMYLFSATLHQKPNHFKRSILSLARLKGIVDIKQNSFYIAGVTSRHIYLGNEVSPLSVLIINTEQLYMENETIKSINVDSLRSGRLVVDSPYFYLSDRINKTIFRGLINECKVRETIRNGLAADLFVPMDHNSLAIRIFTNHGQDYTLGKESLSSHKINIDSEVLERKANGIFSNDGMLDYCSQIGRLIYIYYHRNQYIGLDTNLNVLFRALTVDTAKAPEIKTAFIKSENVFTIAQPPGAINQSSCCYQNDLFIHSTIKADNDNLDSFEHSDVIDVYDIGKGAYKYSFYLAKFKEYKIKNFALRVNYCAAVSGHYLLLYTYKYE